MLNFVQFTREYSMNNEKVIITLTGPSGTGKTFLSFSLFEHGFSNVVSTTTRMKRPGEVDGADYHFVTKEQFDNMDARGEMIEKVDAHGIGLYYGVSLAEAEKVFNSGKNAAIVVEPDGKRQIEEYCEKNGWTCVSVFVNNPVELLFERILLRFSEQQQTILKSSLDTEYKEKEIQKIIKSNAERLKKLTTFEQEKWVKPAYNGSERYDLVIDNFNSRNTEKIISSIIETVNEKMTCADYVNDKKKIKM